MKYHWLDKMDGLIIEGDIIAALAQLEDESVEAIVTDPPYDLLQGSRKGSGRSNNPDSPAGRHGTKTGGFMGMAWDATGVAFNSKTWEACLRVLKPGGHLVVFGGTRTHHRMWVAIEDAGFEVRDMLLWMYGQGFPKSMNVGKSIDKAGGADRAHMAARQELAKAIRDARKQADISCKELATWFPQYSAVTANWERFDVGFRVPSEDAYNLLVDRLDLADNWRTMVRAEDKRRQIRGVSANRQDDGTVLALGHVGSRFETTTDIAQKWDGWGTALKPACEPILLARKPLSEKTVAANVLKHGTGALNIDASRIGYADSHDATTNKHRPAAARRTESSADLPSRRKWGSWRGGKGRWPANVMLQCTCDDPQPLPEKARKRRGEPSQEQRYDKEGATNFAAKPGTRREGGGFIHESDCPAGMLDEQSGIRTSGAMYGEYKGFGTQGIYGEGGKSLRDQKANSGGASRFFATMRYSDQELLLSRAKAIMGVWNSGLANTVDNDSSLPSEAVASALNDVVILASQGEIRLNGCQVLSTSATPSELKRLCENAIALTLSIELKSLPASFHIDTEPLSAGPAKSAVKKKPTDTTTITRSPTNSDGCAVAVTLTITKSSTVPGEQVSVNRFNYCPKATKKERGEGNLHPTVKPIALMRYLVRLVTPPDGVVLDPFCGSGSTLIAATEEGFGFIGVDVSKEYCEIAQHRLKGRKA